MFNGQTASCCATGEMQSASFCASSASSADQSDQDIAGSRHLVINSRKEFLGVRNSFIIGSTESFNGNVQKIEKMNR